MIYFVRPSSELSIKYESVAWSRANPDYKRIVAAEDFDILQRAYSLIGTFWVLKHRMQRPPNTDSVRNGC